MSDYSVRADCRLCHHDRLETLLKLPDTPLANEYLERAKDWDKQTRFPLHLVGCHRCGHVQLPVVVDPKRLFPPDYPYQSGTARSFRAHLGRLAGMLQQELPSGARALDIACNDGLLVSMMRGHDLEAYGIDPCAPDKPWAHRAFFTEGWARAAAQSGERFDCITALNVMAHIDDMDDVVRGVKTLLEPCGLFVVEVGYLKSMVEKGRFSVIYHEHVAYYHLSPLVRFFRRHGMTVVDAERIDSQGGSIRLYVRNWDGTFRGADDGTSAQSERLQTLLDEESRSQLWDGVRALGNVRAGWGVRGARDQLKAEVERSGGGGLVLYGAPAKLCTLLHATGMTDAVSYVVDDNPNKVGRYVPGSRIPILPVSTLYERKPRRVIITAWNFADDVMRKHAELGCEWAVSDG
jgi:SAM-dependent methyltransferase